MLLCVLACVTVRLAVWIAGDEIRCARLAHGIDRLNVDDVDDMRRTVAAHESKRWWGVPRAA